MIRDGIEIICVIAVSLLLLDIWAHVQPVHRVVDKVVYLARAKHDVALV